MKKFNYFIGIIFSVLLFVSCGTKVSDNAPGLNFEEYNSYSFLPNQDTVKSSAYNNIEVNEIIIDEINENMQQRDYRLDRTQPDLLIIYHLMLEEEMAVNASPVYTNYSYYVPGYYVAPYYRDVMYENYFTITRLSGAALTQIPYREGSLVIDVVDRRSEEIIWRGTSSDVIEPGNVEAELRDYVNSILANFPG